MFKFLLSFLLFFSLETVYGDAVIFSGADVKTLKYNIDLFGRSKVMALTADPSAGGGQAAPLASLGMNYSTGKVYVKIGAPDTSWQEIQTGIIDLTADVTGVLPIANGGTNNSSAYTAGSIVFSNGTSLTQDNASLFWDDSNNRLGLGTATPLYKSHTVLGGSESVFIDGTTSPRDITTGVFRIEHRANMTGTRPVHLLVNSNGFGDTHAINVDYNASSMSATQSGTIYDTNVDTASSTGGRLSGYSVSKTGTGIVDVDALQAFEGVNPIRHLTGSLAALDAAFIYDGAFTDTTTAFGSSGTNVQIFVANNDYIYIGHATKFNEIQAVLSIVASGAGVKPTFEFSIGAGAWTVFSPNDGTNGFRINGSISFSSDLLTTWATDTVNAVASKYWIRIRRTQVSLATPPTESTIKIVAATTYYWNKTGDIYANSLSSTYTQGSVLFSGAAGTIAQDNANLFWNDAANSLNLGSAATLKIGSTFEFNTLDALSRTQIWNKAAGSILRLGSSQTDGDATDVATEGIIAYDGNLGGIQNSTNVGYARVKHNRFGLYSLTAAGGDGYYFRVDPTSLYLADNSMVKTFEVARTTGNAYTTGTLGVGIAAPTSTFHSLSAGAKTAAWTGNLLNTTATSSTASIAKVGLDVQSTGTWNGASATNTGLVVNVSGGTTNYAATFSGGNVGIATTTPTAALEVNGSALFDSTVNVALETDSSTTGAAQTIGATKFIKRMTNASLTSVAGITAPTFDSLIILVNLVGADVTIQNDVTATAADRILTGTGNNIIWSNGASLWLVYDLTSARWRVVGGSGSGSAFIYGSTGSPRSVVAATGITTGAGHMSASLPDQIIFATSSVAGASTAVTANPQITAHTVIGAKMRIIGTSDTDVFTLSTGNGLWLNGDWASTNHNMLTLIWDGTVWVEEGRN